jgi:uncharacterized protein (DUF1499 family)
MPLKDLIQSLLSQGDIDSINKALDNIQTAIAGKMVNLTPEERQKYGSINEQNKLMVNKVNEVHSSHPQFDSAKVDWTEFIADFAIRSSLEKIISRLQSLAEQFDDTKILHDNDNYQQALAQYSYISFLSDQNEPGITTVKEDIAQFFNRTGAGDANPK